MVGIVMFIIIITQIVLSLQIRVCIHHTEEKAISVIQPVAILPVHIVVLQDLIHFGQVVHLVPADLLHLVAHIPAQAEATQVHLDHTPVLLEATVALQDRFIINN